MATCPRCLGPLTEGHRCPGRGRLVQLTDLALTVGLGSLIGLVVCVALVDRPAEPALLISAALGAVLAQAFRKTLGPRF